MGIEQTFRYCGRCRRSTMAYRPSASHILHLLLTILTGGIWLIVWFGSCVRVGGWKCGTCGKQNSSGATVLFLTIIVAVAAWIIYVSPEYRRQFQELINGHRR